MENVKDYSDYDEVKEKEADDFAVKWTLTEEEEKEILQKEPISKEDIINFAKNSILIRQLLSDVFNIISYFLILKEGISSKSRSVLEKLRLISVFALRTF